MSEYLHMSKYNPFQDPLRNQVLRSHICSLWFIFGSIESFKDLYFSCWDPFQNPLLKIYTCPLKYPRRIPISRYMDHLKKPRLMFYICLLGDSPLGDFFSASLDYFKNPVCRLIFSGFTSLHLGRNTIIGPYCPEWGNPRLEISFRFLSIL